MYKPPITIYQALRDSLNIQLENNVCKAVASYGINVDKDELIKALKYDREQYEKGYTDGRAECPEWIPCSERLPSTTGYYLISKCCHPGLILYVTVADFKAESQTFTASNVIAWMPLPEPYKEETE